MITHARYSRIKDSMNLHDIELPHSWSVSDLQEWLLRAVTAISIGKTLDITDDFFERGFDR